MLSYLSSYYSMAADVSLYIHNIVDGVIMYELLIHDIVDSVLMYRVVRIACAAIYTRTFQRHIKCLSIEHTDA
jgi:hypothetical protein